jgi:hypothetical protein
MQQKQHTIDVFGLEMLGSVHVFFFFFLDDQCLFPRSQV